MKRRKRVGTYLMAVAAILFVAAGSHPADAQSAKPLKFGMVYATSGAMALDSEGLVLGHKLAADEIMKAGGFQGRKVEFLLRDDAGNPELTTRFCRELITKDQVDWVLTGLGSAVGLAGVAVANEYKKPTFIVGGGTEKITTEEWNPYIFRYRPTCIAEARAMAKIAAEEMLKDMKDPKIFWISWDYEYGRTLYKPFMAKLKELRPDVKIAGEAWPRTGEVDYSPFIGQMLALKPHLVVNAIWGGGVVSLLKQGSARGVWDIAKFISAAEMMGLEFRKAMGSNLPVGAWGSTYDDPSWPQNEAQKKYYKLYSDFIGKPNSEPANFTFPGYNMMHLINKGMQKARSTDPVAVCKAMEGITMDTHLGLIKIREFDHQVTSGYIWGPAVKKEGLPYLVMDGKKMRYVASEKDFYTKEEWTAIRKAAGK